VAAKRGESFNTQPPEGGWEIIEIADSVEAVSTQNAANPVLPILNVGFSFRNYAFLAVFLCNKIKDRKIFAEHIIIIRESVRKNLLLQINVVEKISNNTCITTFKVVLYAHGQTTRPAENVINQLTAYGRIGVKK